MQTSKLSVGVDPEEIVKMAERLSLAPREVDKAIKRAINKTAKAISTLIARDVARTTQTTVALIRGRMKLIAAERKPLAKIIIVTNTLPAILLGIPSPSGSGITVRGHRFSGGFVRFARRRVGRARHFIFRRVGRVRLPLNEMRINVRDAINDEIAVQEMRLKERLLVAIDREIKLFGGLFRG